MQVSILKPPDLIRRFFSRICLPDLKKEIKCLKNSRILSRGNVIDMAVGIVMGLLLPRLSILRLGIF